MFNVRLVCIGKLKEKYLTDAVKEYEKRLTAYAKFEIVELKESFLPENPSEKEIKAALSKEAADIIKACDGSKIILLAIEGKIISSEELSEKIAKLGETGFSSISFVIGSSFGIDEELKKKHDKISMSKMTFPHQLARVMVCEQIYRAFSILNNGKYHK